MPTLCKRLDSASPEYIEGLRPNRLLTHRRSSRFYDILNLSNSYNILFLARMQTTLRGGPATKGDNAQSMVHVWLVRTTSKT